MNILDILSRIKHFIYDKRIDGRLDSQRFFGKYYRQDFVNTLRLDMIDILAAQKVQEETFKKYRNCNFGKDVVVVATGPSLEKYKPIENTLHIGMNSAILRDNLKLDYVFMQDYLAVKDYINNLEQEKFKDTKKFFGITQDYIFDGKITIPESVALRLEAERYYFFHQWYWSYHYYYRDIAYAPIATGHSVAFSAIQFALYTNPKRIYLVGIDCGTSHWNDGGKDVVNKGQIEIWKNLKRFAEIYYPETEIISVNPVGLKGLFTDLYQE